RAARRRRAAAAARLRARRARGAARQRHPQPGGVTMAAETPVLELIDARAASDPDEIPAPALSLRLMPGELALIDVPDPARAAWFADLCCGMVPLTGGTARFLGREWARMPRDYAAALRGRIGRMFGGGGGWVDFFD